MKLSLALVSLGLCVAPTFAQTIATMTLESVKETWDEHFLPGQCIDNTEPDTPVDRINVQGAGVMCWLYPEAGCNGQGTGFIGGKHELGSGAFVGSFDCMKTDIF
ncbi:hypothetical protein BDW42DRAFT_173065 [Aspergillus taichungensis]|uniref:Uncharacterized protein n=1 Tax=Aspergillus taichungensis TaxID=482145 RepID=A0A2J5HPZ8_9EURO|nr:hypothetical protein BDW42DRAFT_173065 [Aspergillus taichungensis]